MSQSAQSMPPSATLWVGPVRQYPAVNVVCQMSSIWLQSRPINRGANHSSIAVTTAPAAAAATKPAASAASPAAAGATAAPAKPAAGASTTGPLITAKPPARPQPVSLRFHFRAGGDKSEPAIYVERPGEWSQETGN